MKKQKFEVMMNLAEQMVSDFESGKFGYICAIGHYDFARELLEDLIFNEVPVGGLIELHDPYWKGYGDEFIVSVADDGVTIEQAKLDGKDGYLDIEADKIYVHEKCNSKIIQKLHSDLDEIYEIGFELDEEECKKCDEDELYSDEKPSCRYIVVKKSRGNTISDLIDFMLGW